jgi:DNA gyrase subunit A
MGVQFATPDRGDSIVAVARNADNGVEERLEGNSDDVQGEEGSGADPTRDGAVPTVINSATETAAEAGSLAAEQDADDNAGGSE